MQIISDGNTHIAQFGINKIRNIMKKVKMNNIPGIKQYNIGICIITAGNRRRVSYFILIYLTIKRFINGFLT